MCCNGHEFNISNEEAEPCQLFSAYFGDSFVAAEGVLDRYKLGVACPIFNQQLAMQMINFNIIEANIRVKVPAIKKLLDGSLTEAYIQQDDADIEEDHENTDSQSYPLIGEDLRPITMRQIRARRGQRKFRQALRKRYSSRCMITGCQLIDIIEAVHISPYRGE